jgi:hypothetical protein
MCALSDDPLANFVRSDVSDENQQAIVEEIERVKGQSVSLKKLAAELGKPPSNAKTEDSPSCADDETASASSGGNSPSAD